MNETIYTSPHTPSDPASINEPSSKVRTKEIVEQAKQLGGQAKEKGQEYLTKSNEFLDRNSTKLGEKLGTVSEAGDPLKEHIGNAQQHLGEASQYLQSKSPEDIGRDLIHLGQRNPKAAAGVLFGIGFLIARKFYS